MEGINRNDVGSYSKLVMGVSLIVRLTTRFRCDSACVKDEITWGHIDRGFIMSERKLVEAFQTFFEKSVSPHLSDNDQVMREWNHLNKIISANPIDYSQIEFYLLLQNKNQTSTGSKTNIPSAQKIP